jgi:hypothetical protein
LRIAVLSRAPIKPIAGVIEGVVEADAVAAFLRDLTGSRDQWDGTASDFLQAADKLQRQEASIRRPDWPRTPQPAACVERSPLACAGR